MPTPPQTRSTSKTPRLKTLSLAFRLDEASAQIRSVAPVKIILTLSAGLLSLLILPSAVCIGWALVALLLETWSWFATLPNARDRTLGRWARATFVVNRLLMNGWWLILAGLYWNSGSLAGQATAAAMVLGVVTAFMLLFHNAPATFLAAGAFPAIAALAVFAHTDGRDWPDLLPVGMVIGLYLIFCLGRALDMPSAQETDRRLNASLSEFKILADHIADVVTRTDMNGVYQYVSASSLPVLGYRPEELVGKPRLALLHPDDVAQMVAGGRSIMANPDKTENLTLRMRHKDGRWLWIQSGFKLVRELGVPVGFIGVGRDVTDRVAADEALREAKRDAECANQAKAEFLANVSHEIRTPMNGVLAALHLLESEPVSAEGRELMRQANACGRMLSQLLNDVLDFSRIDAGQLELAPEVMDAGEALSTVVALLTGEARAKGVDLRCEIAGEDRWIEADPVRLQQAMFNLLGNAVKFTARGHVTARMAITRGADEGRSKLRLEVEDSGIGMTAAAQTHLFERFRQAESDTARRFGGAGLGLSITRDLVTMMGGTIGFTSAEGVGSTFWLQIDLPAARQPELVDPAGENADLPLEGVSILMVEDNATNRLVARTLLSRLGARVTEAEDGLQGLEAARVGGFDLVLMDIQMPHTDGVAATRAIRGLPGPASEIPIIGLTANVMTHQRAQYLQAGMNGVVAKPISPAALLGEIARLVAEPLDTAA